MFLGRSVRGYNTRRGMVNFYDIIYGAAAALAAPYWLLRPAARTKVLRAVRERMGRVDRRESGAPAVWIHAVSLGEINATRELVRMLRERRDDLHVIISSTTDTGFERGRQLYVDSPNVTLIRYPLDFSASVKRALDALRPGAVVLMELEVWPNFVRECEARDIPVIVANGRLTSESFRRYRMIKPVVSRMFRRVKTFCAQDELYGRRFIQLGARPSNVRILGTMKFDTAQVADRVGGADMLARQLGLRPGDEKIWVCGSTGPGEEQIVLDAYRALRAGVPNLRLAIVPRKPERFDEVADLIRARGFELMRRSSQTNTGSRDAVVLGDTMGELRKFYSLADVVFVGRSLVDLGPRQHGSDMIEPAALARPTVIGPFTGNFAEVMRSFLAADAMVEVHDPRELGEALSLLLKDPKSAAEMGTRARDVVIRSQGATRRHADVIFNCLPLRI